MLDPWAHRERRERWTMDRAGQRSGTRSRLARKRLAHELEQDFGVERFREETERPFIQSSLSHGCIVSPAEEDDAGFWRIFPEHGLHLQAVHLRHPDVEDCHTTRRLLERREKGHGMAELFHLEAARRQQTIKRPEHREIVVEDANRGPAKGALI